jgi:hypothetical protein
MRSHVDFFQMLFKQRQVLAVARRIANASSGATQTENPEGVPRFRSVIRVETTRGTCIYSFVLHAPPVALEQIEGALETQSRTLRSELNTLKALMEA